MSQLTDIAARGRTDVRRRAVVITLLGTLLVGALIALSPGSTPSAPKAAPLQFADLLPTPQRPTPLDAAAQDTLKMRFEQGVAMLHMRQYEYAMTAFHQVLALAPTMPEAHVNMGFALLGLEQWKAATDFFDSAIELRREQLNAYYGLAIALEAQGDMPGAIGAMQSYLHRASAEDPYRKQAEAALWEWRARDRAAREPAPTSDAR